MQAAPPASQKPSSDSAEAKPAAEAPATAAEEKQPIDKVLTAESARLIDALSKVLAKTMLEDRKTWEALAAKATQQMTQPAEKDEPAGAIAEKNPAPPTPSEPSTPPKPAWVDQPSRRVDDGYHISINVGPYTTRMECDAKLPEELQKAIDQYLEIFLPEAVGKVRLPTGELQQLVVDRWEETRISSVGKMKDLHVLLQIDRPAQDRIKEAYRQAVVGGRLQSFGEIFGAGFLLLAAVWGYLKIDQFTGGTHRGILRFVVAAVILSIAAAVAIVA